MIERYSYLLLQFTREGRPMSGFLGSLLRIIRFENFWLNLAIWLPVSIYLIVSFAFHSKEARNSYEILTCIFVAMVSWQLFEHLVHHYISHLDRILPIARRFSYMIHGIHHEHPRRHGIVQPFSVTIPLFLLFMVVFQEILPAEYFPLFLGVFGVCYCFYEFCHYACHHPKYCWGPIRIIKLHHDYHHFHDDSKNFSVSFPYTDILFGTYSNPKGKNK